MQTVQWVAWLTGTKMTNVVIVTDFMNLLKKVESKMCCPDLRGGDSKLTRSVCYLIHVSQPSMYVHRKKVETVNCQSPV